MGWPDNYIYPETIEACYERIDKLEEIIINLKLSLEKNFIHSQKYLDMTDEIESLNHMIKALSQSVGRVIYD